MLVLWDLCFCFDFCVSVVGFVFCVSVLTFVSVLWVLCFCFHFCFNVVGFAFLFCSYRPPTVDMTFDDTCSRCFLGLLNQVLAFVTFFS